MASLAIKLFVLFEIGSVAVITLFHQRTWEWEHYLTSDSEKMATPAHSVYSMDRYGSPHYSWFHKTGTQVHLPGLDPQFAR